MQQVYLKKTVEGEKRIARKYTTYSAYSDRQETVNE